MVVVVMVLVAAVLERAALAVLDGGRGQGREGGRRARRGAAGVRRTWSERAGLGRVGLGTHGMSDGVPVPGLDGGCGRLMRIGCGVCDGCTGCTGCDAILPNPCIVLWQESSWVSLSPSSRVCRAALAVLVPWASQQRLSLFQDCSAGRSTSPAAQMVLEWACSQRTEAAWVLGFGLLCCSLELALGDARVLWMRARAAPTATNQADPRPSKETGGSGG